MLHFPFGDKMRRSLMVLWNPVYSLRLSSSTAGEALLSETNLLIPRLCESDNLPSATRLLAASLSFNPSLPPSFSILLDHLTSHPSMTHSMDLLNRLKYSSTPNQPSLAATLIHSYLNKRRPKEALKVFQWMLRPDSLSSPHNHLFRVLVIGLLRCGACFEALTVFREMLRTGFDPEPELTNAVYRGFLRLAMVTDALALDNAFHDGTAALQLLDHIISNWED